jgi:hypothetical protein
MHASWLNLRPRLIAIAASVWLVLSLPACTGSRERYRPVQLTRDEAVVYVYRPRSLLSPGPVGVFVDQTSAGTIGRNSFVAVIVAPGEHLVRVQRRGDATRLVRLGASESVFLEAGASLLGGLVSLNDPGESVARERIARTRQARDPVRLTRAAQGSSD